MKRVWLVAAALGSMWSVALGTRPAGGQTFPTDDPVIRAIWEEGMENSRTAQLAQTLLDSIGPRLTGAPEMEAGQEWLIRSYSDWGIEAEREPYGTWMRWQRGRTHVDLLEPRVRSLEAMLLAWSPGTDGGPARGEVVTLPDVADPRAFDAWLPNASGKFVLVSFPQPTCRPDDDWEEWATEETVERMQESREAAEEAWDARMEAAVPAAEGRVRERAIARRLEEAGAIGVLTSSWSRGWGVHRVFDAETRSIPTVAVGCEDYGLLARLAENGQGPVVEVLADGEFLGEGPVFNVIARIPGSVLPDEYVMLSAHFDSWDGASGATDNGTGTVTMLEAMRILKTVYPSPKRTILVGHWSGEEQGLIGSRAFATDHPEVVEGLQALFNQDDGTGRVVRMSSQGLTDAAGHLARWLARIPGDITRHIDFSFPGNPSGGGTDHASFICAGAPAFGLGALSWNYFSYTWHTNRDTYDKLSFDELRNNATLAAMLAYLASEDEARTPRTRRAELDTSRFGGEVEIRRRWPECQPARRDWSSRR
jgi:carboxypeptidase Q